MFQIVFDIGGACLIAGMEGSFFQLLLEGEAIHRGTMVKVLTWNLDKNGTVGIGTISFGIAHAIDCQCVFHGGGRNDDTARAHAEGIDASAIICVIRQRI